MSFTSRLVSRLLHLSPAETHNVVVRRNIQMPMPDGAILLADHYAPRSGPLHPTILIRSPYGRAGLLSIFSAIPYAARGYQVLIQSCRGTAGSGGHFVYARHEHDDGLATIEWIKQQEWFSGELAMVGASYLGFVQWAIAADAGPELKALVPQITTSDFNHCRFHGGSLNLQSSLSWSTMMTLQASSSLSISALLAPLVRVRRLTQAFGYLPLSEADRVAIGQPSQSFQDNILHAPDDDYWQPANYSTRVGEVTAPIYLMAGWYDLFLDWQLKDFQALSAAERHPHLLIGPWVHTDVSSVSIAVRETLTWLHAHLKGDRSGLRDTPVRLFVMGANRRRDFSDWPPPTQSEHWHLQPHGGLAPLRGRFFGSGDTISRRGGPLWPLAGVWKGPLSTRHGGQPQGPQPRSTPPLPLRDNPRYGTKPTPERGLAPAIPPASEPDPYRYDPAAPTPAVGGNSLGARKYMGPKDNRRLEDRADVLVYTSTVLEQDVEIIGPVMADLYVRSSLNHTDFFARLCVVEPSGKSINVCDGILSLTPGCPAPEADGSLRIQISLWPTAYRFRCGQRIRIQVSSGAHPRFARNLGSGEPLATGTTLRVADQTVYHDPEHPSAIVLPIFNC